MSKSQPRSKPQPQPKSQPKKKLDPSNPYSFTYEHAQPNFRDTWRIFRIMAEFVDGYQFLGSFNKAVTVLGSSRLPKNSKWCKEAEKLGQLLAKNKFATITGGGPSIMESANKGAFEAGGESAGLNIQLPFEQRINPYVKKSIAFYYFFTRKVMMTAPSQAFVFFPGGYGTLDEFFEVFDNIELGKTTKTPIVLVSKEFWNPVLDFMKKQCAVVGAVKEKSINEIIVVDSAEEAIKYVRKSKSKKQMCDLDPSAFYCGKNVNWRIFRIMAELVDGFEFLTSIKDDVTVLGSRSIARDSDYYEVAYQLGKKLAKKKLTVVSGGADGVMEAVSKGAHESGGKPIGITMKFDGRQRMNEFVDKSVGFDFPFVRKVVLTAPSKLFVVFPGGLGTLHELFEILTLEQTGKMGKVPILLYDSKYWNPLVDIIKSGLAKEYKTISPEDVQLFKVVDSLDEVMKFKA